jgi:hypothetical protein
MAHAISCRSAQLVRALTTDQRSARVRLAVERRHDGRGGIGVARANEQRDRTREERGREGTSAFGDLDERLRAIDGDRHDDRRRVSGDVAGLDAEDELSFRRRGHRGGEGAAVRGERRRHRGCSRGHLHLAQRVVAHGSRDLHLGDIEARVRRGRGDVQLGRARVETHGHADRRGVARGIDADGGERVRSFLQLDRRRCEFFRGVDRRSDAIDRDADRIAGAAGDDDVARREHRVCGGRAERHRRAALVDRERDRDRGDVREFVGHGRGERVTSLGCDRRAEGVRLRRSAALELRGDSGRREIGDGDLRHDVALDDRAGDERLSILRHAHDRRGPIDQHVGVALGRVPAGIDCARVNGVASVGAERSERRVGLAVDGGSDRRDPGGVGRADVDVDLAAELRQRVRGERRGAFDEGDDRRRIVDGRLRGKVVDVRVALVRGPHADAAAFEARRRGVGGVNGERRRLGCAFQPETGAHFRRVVDVVDLDEEAIPVVRRNRHAAVRRAGERARAEAEQLHCQVRRAGDGPESDEVVLVDFGICRKERQSNPRIAVRA